MSDLFLCASAFQPRCQRAEQSCPNRARAARYWRRLAAGAGGDRIRRGSRLGPAPPAAAPEYARHGEGAAAPAPGSAGLRPVRPGALPVPEGAVRTQRGYCAGRPDDGREPFPHSRHIPAPGRGDGLHEPEGRRTGTQASHECLVLCAAGRPNRGLRRTSRAARGHARVCHQTEVARRVQTHHRNYLPVFGRVASHPQPRDGRGGSGQLDDDGVRLRDAGRPRLDQPRNC